MKRLDSNRNSFWIVLFLTGLVTAGCGDNEAPQNKSPISSSKPSASAESKTVTASEHEQFEKLYIENCVKAEMKDPKSGIANEQELSKLCECVGKAISKRISKADAVHYLKKHEFPFDLVMMTQSAANTCQSSKK